MLWFCIESEEQFNTISNNQKAMYKMSAEHDTSGALAQLLFL